VARRQLGHVALVDEGRSRKSSRSCARQVRPAPLEEHRWNSARWGAWPSSLRRGDVVAERGNPSARRALGRRHGRAARWPPARQEAKQSAPAIDAPSSPSAARDRPATKVQAQLCCTFGRRVRAAVVAHEDPAPAERKVQLEGIGPRPPPRSGRRTPGAARASDAIERAAPRRPRRREAGAPPIAPQASAPPRRGQAARPRSTTVPSRASRSASGAPPAALLKDGRWGHDGVH